MRASAVVLADWQAVSVRMRRLNDNTGNVTVGLNRLDRCRRTRS
ncbi:hypothetical protein ABZ322_02255 [Streptomyces sp. NPDC006129]